MKLSKYLSSSLYVFVIILTLSGSYYISKNSKPPALFVSKQQSTLNINENFWMYFNLGQKRLISSLYWVNTILDSDVDHYKNRDLNSWMFLRFNTISLIDPNFYENYKFGGPYLSIVKDDLSGADIIYNKGLAQYPDDYSLLLNSGFHYYFEQRNLDKAYPILLKLKNNPQAPQYIISALARIESNRGNLEDSFIILKEYQSRFQNNSVIYNKINEQLYSIKAEMDLNCLNNKLPNCSILDLDKNPYTLKNQKYYAPKKWVPYRPKWKQE